MSDQAREKTIEEVIEGFVRIGRLWAVHGLEIGRASLLTSSSALKATSDLLGTIAESIAERRAAPPPAPPAADEKAG